MTTAQRRMIPNHAIDSFHSKLMDDDQFNEAMMRVALEVAGQYLAPGEELDEEGYELAMQLCCRVSVA